MFKRKLLFKGRYFSSGSSVSLCSLIGINWRIYPVLQISCFRVILSSLLPNLFSFFFLLYFSIHRHSHLSLPFPSIIFSEFLSFILDIIYLSFHLSFSFPVYSFTFFQRIRTNVGSMNVPYKYQVTSGSYALHSPPVTSLCLLTAKPYDIYSYQFRIC